MKMSLLLLTCLSALLVGCSTVNSRIEQKSSFFNSLDSQTQARLKQSIVNVGDTPDMVYIALGRADRVRERATETGHDLTWIYTMHWQEYEGTQYISYRREAFFDPRLNAWRVHHRPLLADVYSEREKEYFRVVFHDGKVTAIEQTKQ